MRSSCENTSRIASLAPTSEPNADALGARDLGAVGVDVDRDLGRGRARAVVPPPTVASVIVMPPATVPLRLPRSRTRTRAAGDRELAVEPRHRRVVDDQIVRRMRADRAALRRLRPGRAGRRPGGDRDAKPPDRAAPGTRGGTRDVRYGRAVGHLATVAELASLALRAARRRGLPQRQRNRHQAADRSSRGGGTSAARSAPPRTCSASARRRCGRLRDRLSRWLDAQAGVRGGGGRCRRGHRRWVGLAGALVRQLARLPRLARR